MTPRVMRELLRRVECARALLDRANGRWEAPTVDARDHLEHVRMILAGAIARHDTQTEFNRVTGLGGLK